MVSVLVLVLVLVLVSVLVTISVMVSVTVLVSVMVITITEKNRSHNHTWARGEGTVPPPLLLRRIGGKINGPIRIWEAAETEFVVKIRVLIHKSRTNSYFDFFASQRFFYDSNL